MKILVVQIGRYGDVILTTPLFHSLTQLPDAEIHVLAGQRYADILLGQKCVHHVHVYKKNVLDLMQGFISLRNHKFDLLIDPKDHFSQESTFIARVIPSTVSIGFNAPGKSVFTHSVPSSEQNEAQHPPLHVVDRNLHPLSFLNLKTTRRRPILECSEQTRQQSLQMAPPYKEGVLMIVLNISAGQPTRQWASEDWIVLGKALAFKGQRFQILAAPPDHARAAHIASEIGPRATVYASTTIQQAIALIERCDVVVSPDSAPIHIASAFNTPCVGLYNSVTWNLHKFGPLSTLCRVVQPESEGEVADIRPKQVQTAVESVLEQIKARRSPPSSLHSDDAR